MSQSDKSFSKVVLFRLIIIEYALCDVGYILFDTLEQIMVVVSVHNL
jgi:hypothetical protein